MNVRRISSRVGLLLVGALVASVALALPASAAPAITVTPNTDLVDFQTVTVSGSGYSPDVSVAVVQCRVGAIGVDDCDLGNVTYPTTDATGAFTVEFTVERIIEVGGTDVDCAPANCVVGAGTFDLSEVAGVAVTFDPTVPPQPRLDISVSFDPTATVAAKTGAVAVRATVTCTKPAHVYLDGFLRQRAGRAYIDAYLFGEVHCDGTTSAVLAGQGTNGVLKGGNGELELFAYGESGSQFDSAFASGAVKLTGAGAKAITA